jgi:hypothetical protein
MKLMFCAAFGNLRDTGEEEGLPVAILEAMKYGVPYYLPPCRYSRSRSGNRAVSE